MTDTSGKRLPCNGVLVLARPWLPPHYVQFKVLLTFPAPVGQPLVQRKMCVIKDGGALEKSGL